VTTRIDQLSTIAGWLKGAARVVALAGAGISTESGIPDFRGPQGLWTTNPGAERLSSLDSYMSDQDVRVEVWRARRSHPAWTATPNRGHRALAELERKGKLDTLITQNIDGLHQAAGNSAEALIEIHGTIREVMCMSCDERSPMSAALGRVDAGEEDPACRSCGGILKSATISFGQSLDPIDLQRAQHAAASCDVLLAVGTSLAVYPVAYLPQIAVEKGARLVIFNAQPTPLDPLADALVREPLGSSLPKLARLL